MEKYLTSLLELNNRVIIPDLGAFIIRQQDPKELVFNDLLAFDDGMLTERLIQEEKLSKSEAQNRIKQFVEKVKKVLQKGDNYHLENLGSLTMDASSRINFLTTDTSAEEGTAAETPVVESGEEKAPEDTAAEKEPAEESPAEEVAPEESIARETPVGELAPEEPMASEQVAEEPVEEEPAAEESLEEEPVTGESVGEEPNAEEMLEEEPVVEEEKEKDAVPEETAGEKIPPAGDEGGFELEEGDAEVDVEAATEVPLTGEAGLQADSEEPPFQIDEQEPEPEPTPESITEPEPESEPEPEPEPEPEIEPESEPESEPEPEPEPEIEPESESVPEPQEDEIPERFRQALAEEPSVDESMTIEELIQKEEEKFRVQVEGVPVNLESDETSFSAYTKPSRRRRRTWPWILGSLFLIAALLVAGWYLFPEKMSRILPDGLSQRLNKEAPAVSGTETSQGGEQAETGGQAEALSIPAEEQAEASEEMAESSQEFAEESGGLPEISKEVESGISETVPTVPAAGKKYYIVAGCFADIRNAENYVRTLRAKGYDASVFGKRDNLHAVCFSSFASKQAATRELRRIQSTFDPSAWILYY
jgi:hypothetical protein